MQRTFIIDQKNIERYTFEDVGFQNGWNVIVKDYSGDKIREVSRFTCKSITKPCHWSWMQNKSK